MENLHIVALYVGLNALLLLVLSYNVGSRRGTQNALEPGAIGDAALTRAIRAHANFAEYVPTVLILFVVMALLGLESNWLHLFGGVFTAGRVIHAVGMMRKKHPNSVRFLGNLITGLALLSGGVICIAYFAGLPG